MPTGTLILILYCAVTTGLAWLLAGCMHRVLTGTRVRPSPVLGPLERACLVAAGPAATRAQGWAGQGWAGHPAPPPSWCSTWRASSCCTRSCGRRAGCPGPPPGRPPMSADLAFDTAVGFVANTDWQARSGEAQRSPLPRMAGLTVQNFVSAATGTAVGVAVIRGPRGRRLRAGLELLDRPGAGDPSRADAAVDPGGPAADLAGRAADARRPGPGNHAGGRGPDHRPGSGGQPDRHPATGHQWRRILRRQRRSPSAFCSGAWRATAGRAGQSCRRRGCCSWRGWW